MGARKLRMSAVLTATLLTAGLWAGQAPAIIAEAGSSPSKTAVAATGSATVKVDWSVERVTIDPPSPATISSPELRILIGGAQAAKLKRPLAGDVPGEALNETLRLRESIQIPRALIQRAVKQRSPLVVVRRFVDSVDASFKEAEFEVTPSGPGTAALSVQRIELTFDDGTRTRVLPKGSELHVVAELNTTGNGLLAGVWEAAFGASAQEPPVFQPLILVRQGVSGGGRTVITSPPLPTGISGHAFVRFRVTDPETEMSLPMLQYYVTAPPPERPAGEAEILLTAPRPGTPLDADTAFSWQAVAGAAAYQLGFHATQAEPVTGAESAAPEGEPLAGLLLESGQTEVQLEASTLARLPGGRSYLWQVVAFDAKGAVIGSSALREIYKP